MKFRRNFILNKNLSEGWTYFDNGIRYLTIMKVNIYKSIFIAKFSQKQEKIIEIQKTY
ncbi:hypothetical protein GCWU000282_00908 [Catonella morbi ATCC 51271]|uniref:Uncharacterized protein n=1 Tax=Catonella morbi ATCC 51271 TaxID=592026 RepID=V2Y476_9FIRM|nr:hypothetical protein GCWU000282_00908 [Catonella morbi ATCC 51271]